MDSDGCAFDAMDIKHLECFTPCYIKCWDLEPISTLAREIAIFVNLRSTTRGLNRWMALKQVLDLLRDRAEVAERGFVVPEAKQSAEVSGLALPTVGHGHRRVRQGESYLPSEVPWETLSGSRTFVQPVVAK